MPDLATGVLLWWLGVGGVMLVALVGGVVLMLAIARHFRSLDVGPPAD